MKQSLSGLLKARRIRKVESDASLAKKLLSAAQRDLKAAKDNLETGHSEWALTIAYNAMLSSGRGLMAASGYGASSDSHHLNVVEFCEATLPADASVLVSLFNKYRMRRHNVVYGEIGEVGTDEAKKAIETAEKFLKIIEEKLGKKLSD